MTLAAAHLPLAISLPVAIMTGMILVWYWWRLGRAEVPSSRRKIRRVSIVLMLASLPMFVRGLSLLDPAIRWREYLLTWMMAMLMVALVMITAVIDAVNNVRIHRDLQRADFEQAARDIARDVQGRRGAGRSRLPGPDGEHAP